MPVLRRALGAPGRRRPRAVLDGLEDTEATLALLPEVGVDLEAVAERLLADGLAAFDADLAKLLATIEARLAAAQRPRRRVRVTLAALEEVSAP
ncbi:MAG: hypothetical protein ACRDSG_02490 [Pseudonocardiaceae bacterium]